MPCISPGHDLPVMLARRSGNMHMMDLAWRPVDSHPGPCARALHLAPHQPGTGVILVLFCLVLQEGMPDRGLQWRGVLRLSWPCQRLAPEEACL